MRPRRPPVYPLGPYVLRRDAGGGASWRVFLNSAQVFVGTEDACREYVRTHPQYDPAAMGRYMLSDPDDRLLLARAILYTRVSHFTPTQRRRLSYLLPGLGYKLEKSL